MKDNTSKKENSKKQAKTKPYYEKYSLKNRSNILAIIVACIAILIAGLWVLTGFGLGISYYLFESNHYFWGTVIILFDLIILRSYLKTKV